MRVLCRPGEAVEGSLRRCLVQAQGCISAIAISPDGSIVALAAGSGSPDPALEVCMYDAGSGQAWRALSNQFSTVAVRTHKQYNSQQHPLPPS